MSFYRTLMSLSKALDDRVLLDVFPVNDPANVAAQYLRKGLIVSVFAAFETYLEAVVEELLLEVAAASIGYSSLPESVRKVLTSEALTGLATRMSFLDKADKLAYAELQIAKLAGFRLTPPSYSSAGFSPKGSNIGHEDIKHLFAAFGVVDPWRKMADIATSLGGARLSIADDFKNLSSARNSCAHDAGYVIATGDVAGHMAACATAAIAIDILAMKCAQAVKAARQTSDVAGALIAPTVRCRFVDMDTSTPDQFLERTASGTKVYRRHQGLFAAVQEAGTRAAVEAVVVRDGTGRPFLLQWHK